MDQLIASLAGALEDLLRFPSEARSRGFLRKLHATLKPHGKFLPDEDTFVQKVQLIVGGQDHGGSSGVR